MTKQQSYGNVVSIIFCQLEVDVIRSAAQVLLEEEYPIYKRSVIVPCIEEANQIVTEITGLFPFLVRKSAKQTVGMIRKDAIEEVIQRVYTEGIWGIECEFRPNYNGSSEHLELITNRLVMTINQAPSIKSFPREALFRNILCASNDDVLFADYLREGITGTPYGMITYGFSYGRLSFARIGIPQYDWGGWLAEIDLLKEPRNINLIETAPVEIITDESKLEIKTRIIKEVLKDEK